MAGEYLNYRLVDDAVLYFSNLLETRTYVPTKGKPGEPRYNLKFLVTEGSVDDLTLQQLIVKAFDGKVPERHPMSKTNKEIINNAVANAIKSGKDGEVLRAKMTKTLAGKRMFSAHATAGRPPVLATWVNNEPTNLTTPALIAAHKDKFYEGVLIRAEVSVSGYTEFGGGVTGYFNSVFSQGHGDRIGGTTDATAFAGLVPIKGRVDMSQYRATAEQF